MKNDTELIILGTGNAMAVACYNTCFALRRGEECFLVDAGGGNGIFTQLQKAEIPIGSIHHIFLTHAHTDHILGMVWMVRKIASMMLAGKYEGICRIYCHEEAAEALVTICRLTLAGKFMKCVGERILIEKVKDKDRVEFMDMSVCFFDICSTKMKQYGFQAFVDGKKLTCLGDEPFREEEKIYAEGSDYLLCEAFCLDADKEVFKPYEKHHSTALDAGRLAKELHIKTLVLYHTEDSNLSERKERYTREAAEVFDGTVLVPDDLERVSIT